jgi:hypothetical protein
MANIFRQPLVIVEGTGVTASPNNTIIQGKTNPSEQISIAIGNDVSITGNVVFGKITSSARQFSINNLILTEGVISGSINLLGDITIGNTLVTNSNMNISNKFIAGKLESELSQSMTIFESGSSLFGDTLDDTHNFTGSFLVSGSINFQTSVNTISNDTSLSGGNSTDLITENAAKTYLDDNDTDALQLFFRKCFAHTGSFVNSTTSSFTAVTASAPTGVTSISENDFVFFINGQLMEHDGISVQQNGSSLFVYVDSNSIGYDLTTDDEIVAWGKFNS